jgi:hypothetical protein
MLAGAALALATSLPGVTGAGDLLPSVRGDVRVAGPGEPLRPMRDGERLRAGSTVTTGEASRAILRFPDGQCVALGPRTALRVVDYRYEPSRAEADRSHFDLLRGAARVVTGTMGRRSPDAIALRTPHVMIQARDGDFIVAVVNPTYVRVREGAIVASNVAGRMVFVEGVIGAIAGAGVPPAVVPPSALPGDATAAFEELEAITAAELGATPDAGGRASGAGAAAGLPPGGIGAGVLLGAGAAAAALLSLVGSGDSTAVTHHHR